MKTLFNKNWGRGLPRPRLLISLGIVLLVVVVVASIFAAYALDHGGNAPSALDHGSSPTAGSSTATAQILARSGKTRTATPTQHPTATATATAAANSNYSFGFTVAGDYGQTSYTTANLNYIAQQYTSGKIQFHLALGDFSYDSTVTPAVADAWSAYAKSLLPANFPFEIVSGGHDSTAIDTYAADLPDHLGNIVGTYAKQYYFDYPPSAPLARFIVVTPSEVLSGYSYSTGDPDYNWVASAIDGARAAGIRWVIVAMHQYCFVIDSTSCSDQDLLDLLLSKHVDLILQAQKHTYQASKQLTLNGACPILPLTYYNANCVVNATNTMTKGAGSVIVVTGTGGTVPQLAIDTSDPKISYFRAWMGANINETWGVSQFTLSATQLTMHFVNVSGGFTDSFVISG